MAGIISALLIILSVCVMRIKSQAKELKRLGEELKTSRMTLEIYKATCQQARGYVIPKGTIDAVKYAMIHNHPDNGGNIEKFILYRKCYESLTGRK